MISREHSVSRISCDFLHKFDQQERENQVFLCNKENTIAIYITTALQYYHVLFITYCYVAWAEKSKGWDRSCLDLDVPIQQSVQGVARINQGGAIPECVSGLKSCDASQCECVSAAVSCRPLHWCDMCSI